MKVIIQASDFNASHRLVKFADSHIQKLATFSDHIIDSRACLKTDDTGAGENRICELHVAIPGNDLFASKRAATFEESVVRAVDAIRHQLEKQKTLHERQRAL